ncbi:MAG: hypothetical protein DSY76_01875 [Bacteroidetes bacterium]|nr:MAG: hypothetical protein DSY76_01875 [Bacteroidota bacterium]
MEEIYTIQEINNQDSTLLAQIDINAKHAVFKGHFPQRAVLPGVLQIEMIKTVLGDYFSGSYQLVNIKNAKYLNMILPDENQCLALEIKYNEIEENAIKVKAVLKAEGQVFLKFSGEFVADNE